MASRSFSEFERQVHLRMNRIMTINEESLLAQVQQNLPEPSEATPQALELYPVQSFVETARTSKRSTSSKVVVPAFAVHWGVVVGPTWYHLVFLNADDANFEWNDPCRSGKPIRFTFYHWNDDTDLKAFPVVGHTKFNHIQLCQIGQKLVAAFGDYHRLFWNCQVFAKCFLRLITTDGNEFRELILDEMNGFDSRLTSADATHLFLCGFVVTAPNATTLKIAHEVKRKRLEDRMQDFINQMKKTSGATGSHSRKISS